MLTFVCSMVGMNHRSRLLLVRQHFYSHLLFASFYLLSLLKGVTTNTSYI